MTRIFCLIMLAATTASADITRDERHAQFEACFEFSSMVKGGSVNPNWLDDGARFWYTDDEVYYEIETATGDRRIIEDPRDAVEDTEQNPAQGLLSPDGTMIAITREFDLYLEAADGSFSIRLTHDGSEEHAWGTYGALWSPDGAHLAVIRFDTRGLPTIPMVDWLDAAIPVERIPYPTAGEPRYGVSLAMVDVATQKLATVSLDGDAEDSLHPQGWTPDGQEMLLIRFDRLMKRQDLLAVARDGQVRTVITERSETFIDGLAFTGLLPHYHHRVNDESFLWLSQRDGYHHLDLYRYDGTKSHAVTRGDWPVVRPVAVDNDGGWVYFLAQSDTDSPYDRHLCRVGLGGENFQQLTADSGRHAVTLSPDFQYFIDNHSDANRSPRSDLRRTDGTLVATLAEADVSALDAMAYTPPERIVVKAADGKSDVSCALYTPPEFDPAKNYPVVEVIYAGPQWPVVPRLFAPGEYGDTAAALARLGYVTVIIDSPGTAGRGIDYQNAVYQKLGQIEIPDHVAALRNLAATRPWMDIERVGVHGKSWGGYFAIRAMLQAPDFYKVGVASSAVVDLATTADSPVVPYLGLPVDSPDAYAAANCLLTADQLQGRLLITIGTSDGNTPFAQSMQMVASFTEADKDVDLLVLPGQHHWLQGKSFKRWQRALRDYFEAHLPTEDAAPVKVAQINESRFHSAILEEEVDLQVALPLGYHSTVHTYPVLYLLDGDFFMNQAISAVDFLSTPRYMNATIPGHIIVGITTKDRNHDFTPTHDEEYDGMPFPTSGGAPKFQRFLTEELIPYVDSKFRTADSRTLAGWSLGGLFTTWTYLEYPDSFHRYLAISPSLWWDDMVLHDRAEDLAKNQGLSTRHLTMTLGSLERAPMDESVSGTFVPLMEKPEGGENFEFIEIDGEGHNLSPLVALHRGLRSLHRMMLIPESTMKSGREVLAKHLVTTAATHGMHTDDPDAAGQFLIKRTVEQGEYEIGLQIAEVLAHQLTISPRSMVALGEMTFRLNQFEESAAAFETAIAREQARDQPDPEELKYFRSYLEWVREKSGQ